MVAASPRCLTMNQSENSKVLISHLSQPRFLALIVIAALSASLAIVGHMVSLVPYMFLCALAACVFLIRIKPHPLEILFFLIPGFSPTIPAFTGLMKHYSVVTAAWTVLFLTYWYIHYLSRATHQDSIRAPYAYPLIIYRFIFTFSILSHPLHSTSLNYSFQTVLMIGIYWFLVQSMTNFSLRHLLLAVIWGAVASTAVFLIVFSMGSVRYIIAGIILGIQRPMVMNYSANTWAWAPMVGMPLAIALLIHGAVKGWTRWALMGGILVMLLSALLCNSRSALLATGISTIFIMLTHKKARWRLLLTVTVLPVLFTLMPSAWMITQKMFRFKMGLTGRTFLWKMAADYISKSPITGLGPGWFAERSPVDAPPMANGLQMITGKLSTHNAFLMIATDLGILALLPVLFIIGFFTWRSSRLWKKMRGRPDFPVLVAICAMMIAGLTRSFFEIDFIYLHTYLTENLLLLVLLAIQDQLYAREFSSA